MPNGRVDTNNEDGVGPAEPRGHIIVSGAGSTNDPFDLERLDAVLRERNLSRALGGTTAFTGFLYQMHVALLAYVRSCADADGPLPTFGYESIADFVVTGDDVWYTYEVKLTLTRNTLLKALTIFRDVHLAASQLSASTAAKLRFRLCCMRSGVADPIDVANKWAEREDERAAAQAVVANLAISTEKNPLDELYALLANRYRVVRPQQMVDGWTRAIIGETLGRNAISDAIAADLVPLPDDDEFPFVVLTAADKEPTEVTRREGGFLVGEQPTLAHLRAGFFARDRHIDALEDEFWDWHESLAADAAASFGGLVPTFWITGASGSGKSISLLQLLAKVAARPRTTVLWLAGSTDALPAAARFARNVGPDRHVVIGVDDPFSSSVAAAAHWSRALSELNPLRQRGQVEGLPIFVCCGPTEQLDGFTRDQASNIVLKTHVKPAPTKAAVDSLRDWYRLRTGDAQDLPTAEPNMLPAQIFFEWWKKQGMATFAIAFRKRIEALNADLPSLVDKVLSVNRLYVGYPVSARESLTGALSDDLAVLERDLHFERRTTGRAGYWLAHPHLADIVYGVWHPADRFPGRRSEHVADALRDAIDVDSDGSAHARILRAVLGANWPREQGGGPPSEVWRAIAEIAHTAHERIEQTTLWTLATWVRAECAAPNRFEGWSPTRSAVERLTNARHVLTNSDGRVTLLNVLIDSDNAEAVDAVVAEITANPSAGGWVSVVNHLIDRHPTHALVEPIVKGVLAAPREPMRLRVLARTMASPFADEAVFDLAADLLAQYPAGSVATMAAALVDAPLERHRNAVGKWLSTLNRRENGPALAALMRQERPLPAAAAMTKTWLVNHPTESVAEELFLRTLDWSSVTDRRYQAALRRHLEERSRKSSSAIDDVLREMLETRPGSAAWSYVFALLCIASRDVDVLFYLGRWWLANNGKSTGWPHVYAALADALGEPDEEVEAIGLAYLDSSPPPPPNAWATVMRALFHISGGRRPEHAERALTWLHDHQDSDVAFTVLLSSILEVTTEVDEVASRDLVRRWLRSHANAPGWSFLWRAAIRTFTDDHSRQELLELVSEWLQFDHAGWGQVFRTANSVQTDRTAWLEMAQTWLLGNTENDQWAGVFSAVAGELTRQQAAELFAAWFVDKRGRDPSLGFLWRTLIDDQLHPGVELVSPLRQGVVDWLAASSATPSWWHIWSWMHDADPTGEDILEAAVAAPLSMERASSAALRVGKNARIDPAVATSMWNVLSRTERGHVWLRFFLAVGEVAPREDTWTLGLDMIADVDYRPFSAVWMLLWDNFDDGSRRSSLVEIGLRWCAGNWAHESWPEVWSRMVDEVGLPESPELNRLADKWLRESGNRSSEHYEMVWTIVGAARASS
jgi:hypothetical protein